MECVSHMNVFIIVLIAMVCMLFSFLIGLGILLNKQGGKKNDARLLKR
jgi:signal transduction histidine kinase